jgi:pentatricopeptide repeat protein
VEEDCLCQEISHEDVASCLQRMHEMGSEGDYVKMEGDLKEGFNVGSD